jgi:hypothetical protein
LIVALSWTTYSDSAFTTAVKAERTPEDTAISARRGHHGRRDVDDPAEAACTHPVDDAVDQPQVIEQVAFDATCPVGRRGVAQPGAHSSESFSR